MKIIPTTASNAASRIKLRVEDVLIKRALETGSKTDQTKILNHLKMRTNPDYLRELSQKAEKALNSGEIKGFWVNLLIKNRIIPEKLLQKTAEKNEIFFNKVSNKLNINV